MSTQLSSYVHPVLGRLQLHCQGDNLLQLHWAHTATHFPDTASLPVLWQQQLDAYFTGRLYAFEGPLVYQGSEHDHRVWETMLRIPYGQTLTYGEVAKQIHSCAQAVGQACKRNPMPLIIPCHRIVAQNHVGGYSGSTKPDTLSTKHWLLEHERTHTC